MKLIWKQFWSGKSYVFPDHQIMLNLLLLEDRVMIWPEDEWPGKF